MTQSHELLKKAKALLEKSWIKGAAARQQNGREVSSASPKACSFCMLGAIDGAGEKLHAWTYERAACRTALEVAFKTLHPEFVPNSNSNFTSLAQFNDAPETTKEQVLEVYDVAIRLATPHSGQGFNSAA